MSIRLPATFARLGLAGCFMLIATAAGAASAPPAKITASNWVFPGFGENGYKTWDVQGAVAELSSDANVPVKIAKMKLHLFSGKVDIALETTIESDQATVLTGQSHAFGPDLLQIFGSNNSYSVTGYDWSWDGKAQAGGVSISVIRVNRSVMVTFQTEAADAANPTTPPPPPITIMSDTLVIYQQPEVNWFHFEGKVTIMQGENGNNRTTCRVLDLKAGRTGTPSSAMPAAGPPTSFNVKSKNIQSIVAQDHVISRQGNLETSGDTAQFYPDDERVVVSGSPQVHTLSGDNMLMEGGLITWYRNKQEVLVEPAPGTADNPGRVRVTLPPLATDQGTGAPVSSDDKLVITGQSIRAEFASNQRHFDIEKSVRIVDSSSNLTVDSEHLAAEFDPAPPPAAATNPSPTSPTPQMGRLNHLTMSGGVTIYQDNRTTTTQQAEITPARGEILLTGQPHVEDRLSHATIEGNAIRLSTDGSRAVVQGAAGQPAVLRLPSLPGLSEVVGKDIPTKVEGDSVTMQRGEQFSTFTFAGHVHITARNLEVTCQALDAYTRDNSFTPNAPPDPLGATSQLGEIVELIASKQVVVSQNDDKGQNEYKARAARAEIHPKVGVNNDVPGPATISLRRSVELFGDPAGMDGPIRPVVELPLKENFDPTVGTASATPLLTRITSDEQWLLSGPAANTYWFKGNVQVDNPSFQVTCDQMQVDASSANVGDNTAPDTRPQAKIGRILAQDNVHLTQGTKVSNAGRAEIIPSQNLATLSGNVVVTDTDPKKPEHLENANIIYHLDTHKSEAVSLPPTPGQVLKRPTIILPGSTMNFDKLKNPADKAPAGTAP